MSAGPATSPAPTTAALTPASPYGARLRAYLAERFPLLGHGLLIVSYCSSNQFLARRLTAPDGPMRYDWHSLAAGAVILCFFFHLRVFDEHKDYAEDCRFHPERLLQRGVFTLGELRILGLGAIVVQAVIATLSGAGALVAWLLAFGWSLLMLREFFVSAWLKAHFLLYTMSHMLVMPLLALLVYSLATGRPPWTAPAWFWLYSFVGFFVTLNWEISRKIRAPADEIAGLTTYSTIFGTYGAAWAVIVVRVIDTGMVALVGWHLGLSRWFYLALTALFLVCLWGFVDYRRHTNARTAKRLETYAGMYIIAFDLILAVELARQCGLRWGSD